MCRPWLVVVVAIAGGLTAAVGEAATAFVSLLTPANAFSPQTVTVRVGDTVTWTNPSGFHNVFSDDGTTFSSGSPASGPWTYSFTFTNAGTYGYHCQPHGSPGSGSFGTVIVLDSIELAHGSDMNEDLQGAPDRYRIGQKPYSSYEVVVDALAGNPLLQVERVDAAGTTVLQAGQPVTASIDMTQSLRWGNGASAVDSERVRVGNASCPTTCTGNDAYRIRAYETTLAFPRFNQSGTQLSVVILQNPSSYPISGTLYFWNAAGTLLNAPGTPFGPLAPKAALVISAGTVPGLPGTSGTVTVTHNGRYGDLAGKVVALEPATGFSFDTPAVSRPR